MHHSTNVLCIINYHCCGCCINIKYSSLCNDACPVYTMMQLVSRGHTLWTMWSTTHKSISRHRTLQHWYGCHNHYSIPLTLYTIQNTSAFICIQLSAPANHESVQAIRWRNTLLCISRHKCLYTSDIQNNKYKQVTVTANDQNIWQPLLIK